MKIFHHLWKLIIFYLIKEVKTILEYMNTLKNNMVERDESTKISFNFNDHKILKNIESKVKSLIGDFMFMILNLIFTYLDIL